MLVLAMVQVIVAFAPLVESRLGASIAAHIEDAGTGEHHAHDDASCLACVARHLLSSSHTSERSSLAISRGIAPTSVRVEHFGASTESRSLLPRAPPVVS
ncbi:MAG TPA: hypothetical protein VM939_13930 [Gemmatimonadaceae bacterium]|nr:hypothetical protein [Gemmatimonadaceae bacterium]